MKLHFSLESFIHLAVSLACVLAAAGIAFMFRNISMFYLTIVSRYLLVTAAVIAGMMVLLFIYQAVQGLLKFRTAAKPSFFNCAIVTLSICLTAWYWNTGVPPFTWWYSLVCVALLVALLLVPGEQTV